MNTPEPIDIAATLRQYGRARAEARIAASQLRDSAAEVLRVALRKLGLTEDALALRLGLTPAKVARMRKGEIMLSDGQLYHLALMVGQAEHAAASDLIAHATGGGFMSLPEVRELERKHGGQP